MHVTHVSLLLDRLRGLDRDLFQLLLGRPDGEAQQALLKHLQGGPSQSTVSRSLHRLMEDGLVLKSGQTKAARFHLTPSARYWATDPRLRPPAPFDVKRILDYVPNQTMWLPESARQRMAQVAHPMEPLDASTYASQISERFLIDLSWASSAMEGNTYSLLDTEVLIKYGQVAPGRGQEEATMILNHKRAISSLLERVGDAALDDRLIKTTHSYLMRGLLDAQALGALRSHAVRVSGTASRPSSNRHELGEAINALSWKAEHIRDPWEAMFFLTAGISYIQAFEDGNKRLGRLMGNLPLLRAGLPPLSFVGVDKKTYVQGLLVFYEQGDTHLLAETLVHGYQQCAPTYETAHATHRLPHKIELREAHRLEKAVQRCVTAILSHEEGETSTWVAPLMLDLAPVDHPPFMEALAHLLDTLTENNAPAWGVTGSQAAAYQALRDVTRHQASPTPRRGPRTR